MNEGPFFRVLAAITGAVTDQLLQFPAMAAFAVLIAPGFEWKRLVMVPVVVLCLGALVRRVWRNEERTVHAKQATIDVPATSWASYVVDAGYLFLGVQLWPPLVIIPAAMTLLRLFVTARAIRLP